MVQVLDDDRPRRLRPGDPRAVGGPDGGAVGPSTVAALGSRGPRVPPHDLDAEESLLGAMLLSGDAVSAAIEICGPSDFYKPAHGLVFSAVAALFEAGEPVDAVTVADELRRGGVLDQVGDLPALVALQANTPSLANAAHYARIVEEHALLRRLIRVAGELSELGYSVPEDVTAAVDDAERMVFELSERRTTETVASLRNLIGPSLDRIEELSHRSSRITGVETGYHDVDEILAGLQPQSLTIVGARPAMGKALALDTPVPVPFAPSAASDTVAPGWRTMGSLRVGDEVFDDKGQPCRVSYTSPVFLGHRCYRVCFDDGGSLVADAGHRWLAYDYRAWKSLRERTARLELGVPDRPALSRDQSRRWHLPRVVTTEQMLREGLRTPDGRRSNWYLPLTGPVDGPDEALPLDPYVLGCWLGLGATAPDLDVAWADAPHFLAEFEQRGYALGDGAARSGARAPRSRRGSDGRARVRRGLRAAGLLGRGGAETRRVPAAYLRVSAKQRLALLQGLMDTAGDVSPCAHRADGTPVGDGTPSADVELCVTDRALCEQAWELVCSLGHKPSPVVETAVPGRNGARVAAWRFHWVPRDPVFLLPRKAGRLDATAVGQRAGRHTRRTVVAIEEVRSVPVRCIAVSSASGLFLAGRCMAPTHNTSFALGMLAHVGTALRRPALLFSLEMGHVELTQRLLASEARVDSQRMRTGHLHESDWGKVGVAVSRLSESTIFIDENPHLTVMDIRARARRLRKSEGDLGLVVVDYLQLMTGRSRAENRQVEVAEISRGLKILARELNCPVVALSQLSRNLEARQDKRPMLSDLRESGCMPASTMLRRADNGEEVSLGELVATRERPLVWSLDDESRTMVPRALTNAFFSGVKPVFRLRLRSGVEVVATANHKFRTLAGWRRLDELEIGDRLAVPRGADEPAARWGQPAPAAGRPPRAAATALMEAPARRRTGAARPSEDREPAVHAVPDVCWEELVEVSPAGVQPVFDATVDGTHNFVANGIVAHNSLEQDADVVLFIYREEVYDPDTPIDRRGLAEIIVSKHRNGPTGSARLAFLTQFARFENLQQV
jgi:replicative DNA helicase